MDPPLSASTLRLLVPPLRLMSACMWQVAQNNSIKHYGKLQEFMSLVTQAIPEVWTDRKKLLLTLGLRAKVMTERFNVDYPWDLQTFLDRIGSFHMTEVSDVEVPVAEFIYFLQSLLTDQEESEHLLQVFVAEFRPDFDSALLSLVCDLLSHLEEQLPIPNFKQVASCFSANLSVDDCLTADSDSLKSLLQGHLTFQRFEVNETPVNLPPPPTETPVNLPPPPTETPVHLPAPPTETPVHLPAPPKETPVHLPAPAPPTETPVHLPAPPTETPVHLPAPPTETPVHLPAPAQSTESCLKSNTSEPRHPASYMCPHCWEKFPYQFQLVNHLHVHKEGGQFKCSDCGKSFTFSTSLFSHKRTTCKQAAYSCQRCGSSFQSFRGKLTHRCLKTTVEATEGVKGVNPFPASQMRHLEATIKLNRNNSRQRAVLNRKQTYDCHRCGASFRFSISYKRHVEKEHKMKTRATQRLETADRAVKRLRAPLRCSRCPLSFSRAEDLQIHLKSHQPLHCHKCGNSFADLASLVDHMEDEHERKKSTANIRKTSEKTALRCGHCDLIFSSIGELGDHRRAQSIEHLTLDCHKCGVSFTDLTSLAQHVDEHDMLVYKKKFGALCHLCGKFFRTNSCLKQHMKSHSNYRPHCCPFCGKCFSQKGNLTVHIRLHTGERPYVCCDCGKAFPAAGDLQVHQRFHTRTKPYQCKECSSRFYTASHLGLHMRRHRGELRFGCQRCDKKFLRKACLEKHMVIHTGLRAFLCSDCPKTFKRKSHLNSHIKRHHP